MVGRTSLTVTLGRVMAFDLNADFETYCVSGQPPNSYHEKFLQIDDFTFSSDCIDVLSLN